MSATTKKSTKNRMLAMDLLALGGSLAIPMVFLMAWHYQNTAYPRVDAADYCISGQDIYLAFKAEGFISAIRSAYLQRHWKPILLPPFLAPFLIASRGQILSGVSRAFGFFYAAFILYAYAIYRGYLPRIRSFLATVALATWPWVFGAATTYYAELPFYTCLLAALFHANRSQLFRKSGHGAALGVAVALALCFRPVETVLVLFAPVAVFVGVAISRRAVRPRDLIPLVGWLLVVFLLIGIPIMRIRPWSPEELSIFAFFAVLSCLINVFWCRCLGLSFSFQACVIALFAVFLVWYAPFSFELYNWIFLSTFGVLKRFHNTTTRYVWQLLFDIGLSVGILPGLVLAVGALGKQGPKALRGWKLVTGLVGMVAIPILVACFLSENDDPRYYSVIWVLLLVYGLIRALAPEGRWPRIRFVSVAFLASLELLFLTSIIYRIELPWSHDSFVAIVGKTAWTSGPSAHDPLLDLQKEIAERVPHLAITKFNIFGTVPPVALMGVSDPWALTLRSRENGLPWTFDRFWNRDHDEETVPIQLKWVRENYNYIVVGPVEGGEPKLFDPSVRLAKFVLRAWRRSGLNKIGLTLIDRLQVQGQDGSSAAFLLVSTNRAVNP